ncbi:MAG: flagellar motor switch protein FliN [Candidatus Tumulicola sp.]
MTAGATPVADSGSLDVLMHLPLHLSARLGGRQMTVSEVLKLGTGSIVQLDRAAGAPIDILVADKLVARGEIVAVDEYFGVRITELIGASK